MTLIRQGPSLIQLRGSAQGGLKKRIAAPNKQQVGPSRMVHQTGKPSTQSIPIIAIP